MSFKKDREFLWLREMLGRMMIRDMIREIQLHRRIAGVSEVVVGVGHVAHAYARAADVSPAAVNPLALIHPLPLPHSLHVTHHRARANGRHMRVSLPLPCVRDTFQTHYQSSGMLPVTGGVMMVHILRERRKPMRERRLFLRRGILRCSTRQSEMRSRRKSKPG